MKKNYNGCEIVLANENTVYKFVTYKTTTQYFDKWHMAYNPTIVWGASLYEFKGTFERQGAYNAWEVVNEYHEETAKERMDRGFADWYFDI